MLVTYNAKLGQYKSNLGALKTSEYTQIRIFAKDVHLVKIKIQTDANILITDMQMQNDIWTYDFIAPATPCIVWYSFIIEANYETYYFGAKDGETQGEGEIHFDHCSPYQITVYDRDFQTPDWAKAATMYQIFPDRFVRGNEKNLASGKDYHQSMGRKVLLHENWDELPIYQPVDGEEFYSPCDFFGGDLAGIEQSLDYISSLGVNAIYLNPIIEAASNHRYNTADYLTVDPILGSNADFTHLCEVARNKGIKIILDGVYSHTGSDSIYFNKNENYKTVGAYQSEKSEFYDWYTFYGSRDNYRSWWGFDTLPEVNEENPAWQKFVITDENSVLSSWMTMGASGLRIDVADELPDDVIFLMRDKLKESNPQSLIIGEVWEDATTKQSYGQHRKYALGTGLDSVMNYPFRNNCLNFFLHRINGYQLCDFLSSQYLNYPAPMYYTLMNLLSSHDVARAKTFLATGQNGDNMSREQQAELSLTPEQEKRGKQLLKLATALQFTIPGIPSIYYGDEQGLDGLKDPFNRTTFSHKDEELAEFFKQISNLRKSEQVLKTGNISFLPLSEDVIAILRYNIGGEDFFHNRAATTAIVLVINRSDVEYSTKLSVNQFEACIEQSKLFPLRGYEFTAATDMLSGEKLAYEYSAANLCLKPHSFALIKLS